MKQYKVLFFDLDGTVTNSGPGIMKSVQYALAHFGMPHEPESKLRRFIGPSLIDSFRTIYGFSLEKAEEATAYYREMYSGGEIFDLTVYDGITDCLQKSMDRGLKNVLVTSKPHTYASQILERYKLEDYFIYQTGPELSDPSSDKTRLINKALRDLSCSQKEVVMIGDTHFDIDGAVSAGVDSIGVTYGFGTKDELLAAGADYLADSPEDILRVLNIC